jgi:hypothetical protein
LKETSLNEYKHFSNSFDLLLFYYITQLNALFCIVISLIKKAKKKKKNNNTIEHQSHILFQVDFNNKCSDKIIKKKIF